MGWDHGLTYLEEGSGEGTSGGVALLMRERKGSGIGGAARARVKKEIRRKNMSMARLTIILKSRWG